MAKFKQTEATVFTDVATMQTALQNANVRVIDGGSNAPLKNGEIVNSFAGLSFTSFHDEEKDTKDTGAFICLILSVNGQNRRVPVSWLKKPKDYMDANGDWQTLSPTATPNTLTAFAIATDCTTAQGQTSLLQFCQTYFATPKPVKVVEVKDFRNPNFIARKSVCEI